MSNLTGTKSQAGAITIKIHRNSQYKKSALLQKPPLAHMKKLHIVQNKEQKI
jgi:hypothetical protein